MRCKDLSTLSILEFLYINRGVWCNRYFKDKLDIKHNLFPDVHEKIFLAKMKQLINKNKWVTGCPCGCRGDYEITTKGIEKMFELGSKLDINLPQKTWVDYRE